MESIIRNVRDIDTSERNVLEQVLGRALAENQQVIIQIVTLGKEPVGQPRRGRQVPAGKLPDWCDVYAGLDTAEIADIEAILRDRSDFTRPSL